MVFSWFMCGGKFLIVNKMFICMKRIHCLNIFSGNSCGQNDCPAVLSNFRNLRRHLSSVHASVIDMVDCSPFIQAVMPDDTFKQEACEDTVFDNDLTEHESEVLRETNVNDTLQSALFSFSLKLQSRSNIL